MEPISLRTPLALLLISLGTIAAVWWWLATPITLPRAPIDPNAKLLCVSYAPFRGDQTPLVPTTRAVMTPGYCLARPTVIAIWDAFLIWLLESQMP